MAEPQKTKSPKSPESPGGDKAKRAKDKTAKGPDTPGTPRSLAARVERSLKDVDRLLKKSPEAPPQERAMAQLEQAKVSALLQLADAIRENRRAEGSPRA
jgi:hypothetical protein